MNRIRSKILIFSRLNININKMFNKYLVEFLGTCFLVFIILATGNPLAIGAAYRDWETDRKSTRLNSSHSAKSRMPSSA